MLTGCKTREQWISSFKQSCIEEYGFKPGTKELSNCIQQKDEARDAAISNAIRNAGQNIQNNTHRPTTTCSSNPFSNSVTCRSY